MIKGFNFNEWREKYDSYSFKQQKEINNRFESLFPRQQKFVTKEVVNFLKDIPNPKILEIGGWKGELAFQTLAQNKKIILWHNYDICSNAIDKNICKDERFKSIVLTDFAWNLDIFSEYNTCILSHIIEHVRKHELEKLFKKLKNIKYFYIQAPLNSPYLLSGWNNFYGTHILECGWKGITNMLKNYNETIIINTSRKEWDSTRNPRNIRIYRLKKKF